MKYVPPVLVFLALLFVLMLPQQPVQGAGDMAGVPGLKPNVPAAFTSTPTPIATETAVPGTPTPPPNPQLACLRINFEVSGDVAQAGTYEVQEVNGRPLARWTAQAGWQDSGWIRNVEISFEAVHVRVLYQPASANPVE
ncbi:MAG: hypothetical protein WAS33_04960, partial [Candidatus Promineifilaceae bacterium]